MRLELMDYIICPACGGDLTLESFEEKGSEVEEGLLSCKDCSGSFPVILGIPRLLPRELLPELVTGYEDFLKRREVTASASEGMAVYETDTMIAKGFEYEWKKHSHVLDEHELEFHHVLGDIITEADVKDKVVLDAGCGQGRFSYFYKKMGARKVIAFDLGEQTLIAKRNLDGVEDIHIVQASIFNLPFRKAFDLISSIGVIHHTPQPEKGLRALYDKLNERGKIFIWVYGYSSIIPVIKFLRFFTLGRGESFNRFISLFFAVPLYLINVLYNVMRRIPLIKALAPLIPFNMYYDRGFSNIWTISFDKINSGIAVYYRREDLEGWLDRLTDKRVGVLSERYPGKSGSSWRLMAQK